MNASSWVARAELAQQALQSCRLCPRDCEVDRTASSRGAFCRLASQAYVYKEYISVGEEPAVCPTWLIDVSGCSLRCLFCSEWSQVVHPQGASATEMQPRWFAATHAKRRQQGARTISFVGGDPTPSLPAIAKCLSHVADPLPLIWNCNGLLGDQALAVLSGAVATWSVDVKFGNPACAKRLAGVENMDYFGQWSRITATALAQESTAGLPRLIIRHLVMPEHVQCCTVPVAEQLRDRLAGAKPADVMVNWMTTFVPPTDRRAHLRRCAELARCNDAQQVAHAIAMGKAILGDLLVVNGR
ncbi:MAG: hypothetical protein EXR77_18935 [Myxococcales bacterium]|nr:hypothetical protein [Myxococcales bacterium]